MRKYGAKGGRTHAAYKDVLRDAAPKALPDLGNATNLISQSAGAAPLDVGFTAAGSRKSPLSVVRPSRAAASAAGGLLLSPPRFSQTRSQGIDSSLTSSSCAFSAADCWASELSRNRVVAALLHRQTHGTFPNRLAEHETNVRAVRFRSTVQALADRRMISSATARGGDALDVGSGVGVASAGAGAGRAAGAGTSGVSSAASPASLASHSHSARPWRLYTRSPGRLTASMAHLLGRTQPGLRRVVLLGFLRGCGGGGGGDMLVSYSYGYGFGAAGAGAELNDGSSSDSSLHFELQLWAVAPHLPSLMGCAALQSAPQAGSGGGLGATSGLPAVALLARVPLWPGAADGWVKSAGLGSVHLLDPTAVRLSLWEAPADGTLIVHGWLPASWRAQGARSRSDGAGGAAAGASGRLPVSHHITIVPPLHHKMAPLVRGATIAAQAEAQARADAARASARAAQQRGGGASNGSVRLVASLHAHGRSVDDGSGLGLGDVDGGSGGSGGMDEDEVLARIMQASAYAASAAAAAGSSADSFSDAKSGPAANAYAAAAMRIAPIAADLSEEGSVAGLRALHTSLLVCAPFPRQTVAGLTAIRIVPPEPSVAAGCRDSAIAAAVGGDTAAKHASASGLPALSASAVAHVAAASARLRTARCLDDAGLTGYRLALNTGDGLRILTLLCKPAGPALPASLHLLLPKPHRSGSPSLHDAEIVRARAYSRLLWDACARTQGACNSSSSEPTDLLLPPPWTPSPAVSDLLQPIAHPGIPSTSADGARGIGRRLWPIGGGFHFPFLSEESCFSTAPLPAGALAAHHRRQASQPACHRSLRLDVTYAACTVAVDVGGSPLPGDHSSDAAAALQSLPVGLLPFVAAAADSLSDAAAAAKLAAAARARAHRDRSRGAAGFLAGGAVAAACASTSGSAAKRRRSAGAAGKAMASLASTAGKAATTATSAGLAVADIAMTDAANEAAAAAADSEEACEAAAVSLLQQRSIAAAGYGICGDVIIAGAVGLDAEALLRRLLKGRLCNYDIRLAALLDSRQAAAWGIGVTAGSGPSVDHTAERDSGCSSGLDGQRPTGHIALSLAAALAADSGSGAGVPVADVTPGLPLASSGSGIHCAVSASASPARADDGRFAVFVVVADHEGPAAAAAGAPSPAARVAAGKAAAPTARFAVAGDRTLEQPDELPSAHTEKQTLGRESDSAAAGGALGLEQPAEQPEQAAGHAHADTTQDLAVERHGQAEATGVAATEALPVAVAVPGHNDNGAPTVVRGGAGGSDWDAVLGDATAAGDIRCGTSERRAAPALAVDSGPSTTTDCNASATPTVSVQQKRSQAATSSGDAARTAGCGSSRRGAPDDPWALVLEEVAPHVDAVPTADKATGSGKASGSGLPCGLAVVEATSAKYRVLPAAAAPSKPKDVAGYGYGAAARPRLSAAAPAPALAPVPSTATAPWPSRSLVPPQPQRQPQPHQLAQRASRLPLALVGASGSIVRSRVVAVLDVVTGAVRAIECKRLPPRMQPAFDGQPHWQPQPQQLSTSSAGAGATWSGGSPAPSPSQPLQPLQSLSSITTESLAAVRARFLGPRTMASAAAADAWCCGRGSTAWAGAGAGVRELDNSSVCAGKSLAALAHPLYPLALVAPPQEEEDEDEDDE